MKIEKGQIIKTSDVICKKCKYNYGSFNMGRANCGFVEGDPRRIKSVGCAYLLDTGQRRVSEDVKKKIPEKEWWMYCDRFEEKKKRQRSKAPAWGMKRDDE